MTTLHRLLRKASPLENWVGGNRVWFAARASFPLRRVTTLIVACALIGTATLPGVANSAPLATESSTYAVLIGVSGYPSLPKSLRLAGPANDVQLMRTTLRGLGLPDVNVDVIADNVPGARAQPTRAAILGALAAVAKKVKPGDWVIIYVSGHGSQQPQVLANGKARNGYLEPDGLDEIFLPIDVGVWDGSKGTVAGAIIDDEFGEAFARINAQGAHAWAVFDTCHAGDMSKATGNSAARPVTRHVPQSLLGAPSPTRFVAQGSAGQPPLPRMAGKQRKAGDAKPNAGKLISFYASHPDEPAAEERLPDVLRSAAESRYFGVFTYVLAEILGHGATPPPANVATLSALSTEVATRYKKRPYPRPVFEGDLSLRLPFFMRSP